MKTRSKRKKTIKRKRTAKKKAKRKSKTSTAIVKVTAPPAPPVQRKPWVLRPDQVALLKRTVAKGTTDDEFALFLWVAKKHKLDPMTRQLHAVKRWSSALKQEVMAIQIGIDGYRSIAARNHPDYGGIDEPEYEYNEDGSVLLARIRLWKKGFEHPTVAVAFWNEYAPVDLAAAKSFMWAKMPKGQLAKCAESLALRKAYPDLADIYTDEEMSQADDDYSEQGREISVDGRRPSEEKVLKQPEYKKQFGPPSEPPVSKSDMKVAILQSQQYRIESYKEIKWRKGLYALVGFNKHDCSCWDKKLWPYLKSGVGKLASLGITKSQDRFTIVEIYEIGEQTFSQLEGLCVPDIQVSATVETDRAEAAGGTTLMSLPPGATLPTSEPPWEEDRRVVHATFKDKKVELTGDTFAIKEDLKAKFGARWNAPIKGWTVAPSWLQDVKDLCEENGIELVED